MNQLKIEIGDTVRIAEASPYYRYNSNANPHIEGVVHSICGFIDVYWDDGHSNTYQPHDLTLIKKGKTVEFTKSDLIKLSQSETVFVKQRNGNFKVVLGKTICGNDYSFGLIDNYNRDMTITCNETHLDIVAVYKTNRSVSLNLYLKGDCLTLIWERTEQTPAQKEMEVLQQQAKALQEQITKLQGKL
jgi:hypothetical protein